MLNVCCVKWGTLYGAEYVNNLYDMFLRNLAGGFDGRFICFTEDPAGLDKAIAARPLPAGLSGWWNKLYLFRSGVFGDGERILYFDLDTILVGALNEIVNYDGHFAMLRDFYRADGLQSSVMAWEGGIADYLWSDWESAGRPEPPGGDQAWIEQVFSRMQFAPDIWQELHPGDFVSYKAHDCRDLFPEGAKVVVFHGRPRPHEVVTGWMPRVWKVGGSAAEELELMRQAQRAQIFANAEYCVRRNLPELKSAAPNAECAVICAGGPSLADHVEEIKGWQERGQSVFSLDDAAEYLVASGVRPDAHVMEEPLGSKLIAELPGTVFYVSSQLGPAAVHRLGKSKVVIFHAAIDGMQEALQNDPEQHLLVGGGSTGRLRAMTIAYSLGHRNIHLYGFDSSHRGAQHAALPGQHENDMVIDVVVGGESFKATPWMVNEVREFMANAPDLTRRGCAITVHGDGLLPTIA